jgi:hypothetical protein
MSDPVCRRCFRFARHGARFCAICGGMVRPQAKSDNWRQSISSISRWSRRGCVLGVLIAVGAFGLLFLPHQADEKRTIAPSRHGLVWDANLVNKHINWCRVRNR